MRLKLLVWTAIVLFAQVGELMAQSTNSWTNSASGFWHDTGKWSFGIPPGSTQSVACVGPGTKTVTINATTSGSFSNELTVNNLLIAGSPGSSNTLDVANAGTNVPLSILNNFIVSAGGVVTVSNSAVAVGSPGIYVPLTNDNFIVDGSAAQPGVVKMDDGAFWATNVVTTIGDVGAGQFTMKGGTFLGRNIVVGYHTGGNGTLTVGGGKFDLRDNLYGSTFILGGPSDGGLSTGTVWVTGGELVTTNTTYTFIGGNAGYGRMTVSNGFARMRYVSVGTGHGGALYLAGGTITIGARADIGASPGGTGAVWITGGTYVNTNDDTLVGGNGDGLFVLSNGTARVKHFTIAQSTNATGRGSVILAGGQLTVTGSNSIILGSTVSITGLVDVVNSSLDASNASVSIGENGVGLMTVSNSVVNTRVVTIATLAGSKGTLKIQPGSTMTVASNLAVGVSSTATGTVDITGGNLVLTNGVLGVGNNGTTNGIGGIGYMTVSNGMVDAASLLVSDSNANDSSLTVSDGGYVLLHGGAGINGRSTTTIKGGTFEVLAGPTLSFEPAILHDRIVVAYSADGKFVVSNGTVRTPGLLVGGAANKTGTLEMYGGSLSVLGSNHFLVAQSVSQTGIVSVLAGQITVSNGVFGVGNDGTTNGVGGIGRVLVSSGVVDVASLLISDKNANDSSFTVTGSGYVRVRGGAGINGRSTTTINGGIFEVVEGPAPSFEPALLNNRIVVGYSADGKFVVSNGVVRTPGLLVGATPSKTGTFTAVGGVTSVYSNMSVGLGCSTITGLVNIAGGSVYVTNASQSAKFEVNTGILTINSGTLKVDTFVMTNACAQFVRTGGSVIAATRILNPADDTDGDGLLNGWEQSYGLDPLDATGINGPTGDPDGDGMTNLEEFQAGTNPLDSSSSPFRILTIAREGNNLRVTWATPPGKTNALQSATLLTNNFSTVFTATNTVGSGTNYLDIGAATSSKRFYRIRLVP